MTERMLTVIVAVSILASAGCCKSKNDEGGTTSQPTVTEPAAKRFEGNYNSNWGTTRFVENGSTVTASYPKGTMTCEATGDVLTCDWIEGEMRGKALLTRQTNGDIRGTWGKDSSLTNGGPWMFTRI